jgi:hypothetical protein
MHYFQLLLMFVELVLLITFLHIFLKNFQRIRNQRFENFEARRAKMAQKVKKCN